MAGRSLIVDGCQKSQFQPPIRQDGFDDAVQRRRSPAGRGAKRRVIRAEKRDKSNNYTSFLITYYAALAHTALMGAPLKAWLAAEPPVREMLEDIVKIGDLTMLDYIPQVAKHRR
jgi:hypothetical protein